MCEFSAEISGGMGPKRIFGRKFKRNTRISETRKEIE